MQSNGLTGGLLRICEWIARFAYVNLLWLLFMLLGLFIAYGSHKNMLFAIN